jgi:hypothetical protein
LLRRLLLVPVANGRQGVDGLGSVLAHGLDIWRNAITEGKLQLPKGLLRPHSIDGIFLAQKQHGPFFTRPPEELIDQCTWQDHRERPHLPLNSIDTSDHSSTAIKPNLMTNVRPLDFGLEGSAILFRLSGIDIGWHSHGCGSRLQQR